MTIEKIEIGKSVEALGQWNKLSLTVSVLPGQDPESIHKEAKALLDKLLPGVDSSPIRDDFHGERKVGMVEAINACTDLGVLQTFSLLAKGNPDHKTAYDKKFSELSK